MDACGRLMNLQERQDSMELASSVLVERQRYILLRVCRESANTCKHSVLLL